MFTRLRSKKSERKFKRRAINDERLMASAMQTAVLVASAGDTRLLVDSWGRTILDRHGRRCFMGSIESLEVYLEIWQAGRDTTISMERGLGMEQWLAGLIADCGSAFGCIEHA